MSFANVTRSGAAAILRTIPDIRGKGRAASLLNRCLLRGGADPIVECTMAGGYRLRLDLRVSTHMHAYFNGRYCDELISALLAYLRPNGTALDVGANIGMCAVQMALTARERGMHLIAFEPVPSNVEWLTHNLRLNECQGSATVLPFALSDHRGEAEIVLAEDFAGGAVVGNAVIAGTNFWPKFGRQKIRLETLDGIGGGGGGRVDVIKLDIEGHEHKFLQGARATLRRDRPAILMEANRDHYHRQGLDFDTLIPTLLPPNYVNTIDSGADMLFVPRERC